MKSIISIQNIDFFYKTQYEVVNIFNDFNLEIKENEYVVITGKSGSGKSSLLNLVAGFSFPQKGKILVNNKEVNKLTNKELNQFRNHEIGYVFQDFNLIYQFTVLENIMAPLLIAGMNKTEAGRKAVTLLKKVELEKRKNHYPNELSGGEQQRVAIARAVANNPDIILADEPTGNVKKVQHYPKKILVTTLSLFILISFITDRQRVRFSSLVKLLYMSLKSLSKNLRTFEKSGGVSILFSGSSCKAAV